MTQRDRTIFTIGHNSFQIKHFLLRENYLRRILRNEGFQPKLVFNHDRRFYLQQTNFFPFDLCTVSAQIKFNFVETSELNAMFTPCDDWKENYI